MDPRLGERETAAQRSRWVQEELEAAAKGTRFFWGGIIVHQTNA